MAAQTPVEIYETFFPQRSQHTTITKAADAIRSFVLDSPKAEDVQWDSAQELLKFLQKTTSIDA
jgi:hypothetical protein